MQNRRKISLVGLCSGSVKPTFSAELHLWFFWCGQSGLLRSKHCLCAQLGQSGIFHSWFLEAGPGAKHLVTEVTETKTSRGKVHSTIFSWQYLPISWSDCLNGVPEHYSFSIAVFGWEPLIYFQIISFEDCFRDELCDLFLSRPPEFVPEIFFFVLFCCLFSPEGNWQQQEQAHAEGAFVARHWKHKWPACRSSKASSSMKKPCWRQTAGTARPFPPNLWLVTFNGISFQAFELLSNAGVWPAFMVTYYWFQPTSIQSVNVCLCLLDRCQAQSKTQLSEFPGMGSLDPALGKIAFFYLFSLDFDQEKSWCRCIIPKAHPPFWLFF